MNRKNGVCAITEEVQPMKSTKGGAEESHHVCSDTRVVWEEISCNDDWSDLYRCKVPGGWLYRSTRWDQPHLGVVGIGLAFVPNC